MQSRPTRSFLNAYKSLYGDKVIQVVVNPKKKKKKPIVKIWATEEEEHITFATWLTKKGILFFHPANGGKRNRFEALKLRRMGVQSGVPDIVIPIACKGSNSLYIELKRIKDSYPTDNQKYWISELNKLGNKAVVCYGADDAIKVVEEYLN